ncbi:MAG: hypothetical protein KF744_09000 [Taibaiella sp.]|nr:hypothetical protein [Taibaiella sp.]
MKQYKIKAKLVTGKKGKILLKGETHDESAFEPNTIYGLVQTQAIEETKSVKRGAESVQTEEQEAVAVGSEGAGEQAAESVEQTESGERGAESGGESESGERGAESEAITDGGEHQSEEQPEAEELPAEETEVNYESMTKAQLGEILSAKQIEYPASATKVQLLELLNNAK